MKKLGEFCEISKGQQLNRNTLTTDDIYPVYNGGTNPSGYTNLFNTDKNSIIISEGGNSCGYVNFIENKFWRGGHCYKISPDINVNNKFLFYLLKFEEQNLMSLRVGSGLPNIQRSRLSSFEIILPDHETQKDITEKLDSLFNEISVWETKIQKFKHQKQGMMQALLTGKIRLI